MECPQLRPRQLVYCAHCMRLWNHETNQCRYPIIAPCNLLLGPRQPLALPTPCAANQAIVSGQCRAVERNVQDGKNMSTPTSFATSTTNATSHTTKPNDDGPRTKNRRILNRHRILESMEEAQDLVCPITSLCRSYSNLHSYSSLSNNVSTAMERQRCQFGVTRRGPI